MFVNDVVGFVPKGALGTGLHRLVEVGTRYTSNGGKTRLWSIVPMADAENLATSKKWKLIKTKGVNFDGVLR